MWLWDIGPLKVRGGEVAETKQKQKNTSNKLSTQIKLNEVVVSPSDWLIRRLLYLAVRIVIIFQARCGKKDARPGCCLPLRVERSAIEPLSDCGVPSICLERRPRLRLFGKPFRVESGDLSTTRLTPQGSVACGRPFWEVGKVKRLVVHYILG
jgi:hypothetical protein